MKSGSKGKESIVEARTMAYEQLEQGQLKSNDVILYSIERLVVRKKKMNARSREKDYVDQLPEGLNDREGTKVKFVGTVNGTEGRRQSVACTKKKRECEKVVNGDEQRHVRPRTGMQISKYGLIVSG